MIFEGSYDAIVNALRGRGWKVLELPDGQIGGRPTKPAPLGDLASVCELLGIE